MSRRFAAPVSCRAVFLGLAPNVPRVRAIGILIVAFRSAKVALLSRSERRLSDNSGAIGLAPQAVTCRRFVAELRVTFISTVWLLPIQK